jgi:hypothetical protein
MVKKAAKKTVKKAVKPKQLKLPKPIDMLGLLGNKPFQSVPLEQDAVMVIKKENGETCIEEVSLIEVDDRHYHLAPMGTPNTMYHGKPYLAVLCGDYWYYIAPKESGHGRLMHPREKGSNFGEAYLGTKVRGISKGCWSESGKDLVLEKRNANRVNRKKRLQEQLKKIEDYERKHKSN